MGVLQERISVCDFGGGDCTMHTVKEGAEILRAEAVWFLTSVSGDRRDGLSRIHGSSRDVGDEMGFLPVYSFLLHSKQSSSQPGSPAATSPSQMDLEQQHPHPSLFGTPPPPLPGSSVPMKEPPGYEEAMKQQPKPQEVRAATSLCFHEELLGECVGGLPAAIQHPRWSLNSGGSCLGNGETETHRGLF